MGPVDDTEAAWFRAGSRGTLMLSSRVDLTKTATKELAVGVIIYAESNERVLMTNPAPA